MLLVTTFTSCWLRIRDDAQQNGVNRTAFTQTPNKDYLKCVPLSSRRTLSHLNSRLRLWISVLGALWRWRMNLTCYIQFIILITSISISLSIFSCCKLIYASDKLHVLDLLIPYEATNSAQEEVSDYSLTKPNPSINPSITSHRLN